MAFKTATVNASDVAATLADYPSYVDLSRVGITTLAEAQSVRVYADSAKTTEWAREIVSATEMHVKIPSLTSTTVIYIDYDGVSADYAVTDTFGRNAVWSDYSGVWHLEDTNWTDSTGAGNDLTASSPAPTIVSGKLGNGANFVQTDPNYLSGSPVSTTSPKTFSIWGKHDVINGDDLLMAQGNAGGSKFALASSGVSAGVWNLFHGTFTDPNVLGYRDGSNVTTSASTTGTAVYGFSLRDNAGVGIIYGIEAATAAVFALGGRPNNLPTLNFDGVLDEARVRSSALSANWITTEYNNQNDEATFWGTWTDAGGGVTANNSARRQHLMMM